MNGELGNPVPSWPSVCCTKHMRLLQRPRVLLRRAFGVIGKKPGGYAGFVEGVMSGVRHCIEKKLCNSGHMTHLLESRLVSEPLTGWGTEPPRDTYGSFSFGRGSVGVTMQAYDLFFVGL